MKSSSALSLHHPHHHEAELEKLFDRSFGINQLAFFSLPAICRFMNAKNTPAKGTFLLLSSVPQPCSCVDIIALALFDMQLTYQDSSSRA